MPRALLGLGADASWAASRVRFSDLASDFSFSGEADITAPFCKEVYKVHLFCLF